MIWLQLHLPEVHELNDFLILLFLFFPVDPAIWLQVISLYPALVECTTSTSPQVCRALKEALQEYAQLLAPPSGQEPLLNDQVPPLVKPGGDVIQNGLWSCDLVMIMWP